MQRWGLLNQNVAFSTGEITVARLPIKEKARRPQSLSVVEFCCPVVSSCSRPLPGHQTPHLAAQFRFTCLGVEP